MKNLESLIKWLRGKKTFFVAALMVVLSGLLAQGYISEETYKLVVGILTGLGLATLRLGMMKK